MKDERAKPEAGACLPCSMEGVIRETGKTVERIMSALAGDPLDESEEGRGLVAEVRDLRRGLVLSAKEGKRIGDAVFGDGKPGIQKRLEHVETRLGWQAKVFWTAAGTAILTLVTWACKGVASALRFMLGGQ